MQRETRRVQPSLWLEQWVSPAGGFTLLAVILGIATLNNLHVAGAFLDSDALTMATDKVARAVWWLTLTVLATGVAAVLWARQRR